VTDQSTAHTQVRCTIKLVSICARGIKGEHQRRAIEPWHHSQQVLRHIKDKAHHDEIKVDPPTTPWNPTQARRNGLDNERPDSSSPDLTDRQHESPSRDVRGFVRRTKLKREMPAPRKRAPGLLVRFYKLEPAQHDGVTQRTVT